MCGTWGILWMTSRGTGEYMKKHDDSLPLDKKPAVKEEKEEHDEWKSKYLRALADYQNLEKRMRETRAQDIQFATREFIKKLLPALDVLEKADALLKDKGLELALRKLYEVFQNEEVKKLEVVGKPFDPHMMECIEVVEGEKDDRVVEETQPGYTMHDRVLRPAQVKVSKIAEKPKVSNNQ